MKNKYGKKPAFITLEGLRKLRSFHLLKKRLLHQIIWHPIIYEEELEIEKPKSIPNDLYDNGTK